jgi:anaerobic selenocysteine-containing dehydrogenase
MPLDIVHSVCPHDCASACALEVERLDTRRIGRVRGAEGQPYTAGVVCAKVARYAERLHHPDRLKTPLRRTGPKGSTQFAPISWNEALDEVASRFKDAAARHGGEAIWPYHYAGTMGLVQQYGLNRLRHVMGYSRQHSTICSTLHGAGWTAGVGARRGIDPREIVDSELIVIWGSNPATTQVNLMHHVARARKERGAKLVVVDPYRSATAEIADLHLDPLPGTDGALACAVMHVLLRDRLVDRAYLAAHTDFSPDIETHLASRSPDWAAPITGIAVTRIEAFAKLYGAAQRSWIRIGYGFSRQRNGAANVHAVSCLPALTGAWQHRGGGATATLSGNFIVDMTLIEGLDALDRTIRVLDMSRIGPILTGDKRDLGDGPPVTAMLIQNTNPLAVAPETLRVREGFLREDLFVCVHEQFLTETAGVADVVLPATTFLEHDDVYTSYGHTFLQLGPKVVEPVGEARSNHQVLQGLAERLGALHPGFRMSERELIDATLRASNLGTVDELAASHWQDCAPSFPGSHFLNVFGTPDRKFHFAPDWSRVGRDHAVMPRFPDHLAVTDPTDAEHPFRMVTGPSRFFLNTTFTETKTSQGLARRPTARLNPDDAVRLGIATGDLVRLGNRQASIAIHAEVFAGVRPGVIVVESVWPNAAFVEGLGINALTSAEPGLPHGGAVFHDTAVWVKKP